MSVIERVKPQAGYALAELAMALLIASLLAAWGAQAWVNRTNDAQAAAAAVWMKAVHKSLSGYLQRFGPEIQLASESNALAVYGFADWRSPSMDELARSGLLSPGMPTSHRLTGGARIHVWRRGECPGDFCMVEGLVYSERPLLRPARDTPDESMIAQWLLATEGAGGAVHPSDPERIRGSAFAMDTPLPDGSVLPVGTVGMAVTAEQQALWSYLRVRDPRDPDLQGRLSVAGDIHGSAHGSLGGHLVVGAEHIPETACAPEKALAHARGGGGLLVCQHGTWRSAGRFGGGYGYSVPFGCRTSDGSSTANPLTGKCSCPLYTTPSLVYDSGASNPATGGGAGASTRQYVYLCIG